MMKAVVLDKFATVGLPDFDTPGWGRNWSIVALSQQLIDEKLLKDLQNPNKSRSLDLVVIGNENKIALLNLQAFKLIPSHLATSMIRQSLAHHFSEDGSLLFGIQTSGDLFVVTDRLKTVKHIRRPYFVKLSNSSQPFFSRVSKKLSNMVGFLTENNQVVPEEVSSQRIMISSWLSSSQKFNGVFPFLTALPDGFAIFCALSPQDCFIFQTSYETALRNRSIGNFKGNSLPGRWHRILMDRSFIRRWLEEKEQLWFEARICSTFDEEEDKELIGGAMLYAVLENGEFHLVYGIISRLNSHFQLSWEIIQFELDWPLPGESKDAFNLGSRFVARLSSDCEKIAVVINTHIGVWVHVEQLPSPFYESPVKLKRRLVPLCPHGDYEGTHFFKRECWVSDIQWLAQDGYFAVMTQCGCLSIFHSSGSPMIIKTRLSNCNHSDNKNKQATGRFYLSVFHRPQISTRTRRGQPPYPTLKWVDSQQVLTCSSGLKIELFSLKRVFNLDIDYDDHDEQMGRSLMNLEPLVLNDSLTLLFAPPGSEASGISETDKESIPDDEYADVPVSRFPLSPRSGGKTEGEMQFQHQHNSVYKSLVDNGKPHATPAPPTSANENNNEIVVSPVFVYKDHRAPVEYVSVEDDEYDIYGDCSTTSSGEVEDDEEDEQIDNDVVCTVKMLVESCDEDEEEEENESPQPISYSGDDEDTNDNNRLANITNSVASVESAPDPVISRTTHAWESVNVNAHSSHPPPIPKVCLSLPDLDASFSLRNKSQVGMSPTTMTTTIPTTVETYSPPFTTSVPNSPNDDDDDDALQNVKIKMEEQNVTSRVELKITAKPSIFAGVGMSSQQKLESVETFVQTEPVNILELSTVVEEVVVSADPMKNNEQVEEKEESDLDIPEPPVDIQVFDGPLKEEDEMVPEKNNNNLTRDQFEDFNSNQNLPEFPGKKKTCKEPEKRHDEIKVLRDFSTQSTAVAICQTQTLMPSKDNHSTQTMQLSIKSRMSAEEEDDAQKRCRPHCIITAPSPPTSIISNAGPLPQASILTELKSSKQLDLDSHKVVNNDHMAYKSILVPDGSLRKIREGRRKKVTLVEEEETFQKKQLTIEPKEDYKNETPLVVRTISLSKLTEQAIQRIVEETDDAINAVSAVPANSQKIWEQVAKQFQLKVNRLTEHKRSRLSSFTDLDLIESEMEKTVRMLGTLQNEMVEETTSCRMEDVDRDDSSKVKESQSDEAIAQQVEQEQLKSILKQEDPIISQCKTANKILWLRRHEPLVEQFQGRTLPYDASSDLELVEELKRRLQMLKYQQEQSKISGNREFTRFMSSWALASESVLPDLNLQDMLIQPVVFPLPVEPSPEIKPEMDHYSPLSPPTLSSPPPPQQQSSKEPPQISKSQPTFIFSEPFSVKRNKSHQLVNTSSMTRVSLPHGYHAPPVVPLQTLKKNLSTSIHMTPFVPFPVHKFKVGSLKKDKHSSFSRGGKTKPNTDLIPRRSSHLFIKAQPGTTKITKSSVNNNYPLTPRVNATTSAIINSAQYQMSMMRKSIKKTGCVTCNPNTFNFTSNKNDGQDKRPAATASSKGKAPPTSNSKRFAVPDTNFQRSMDKLADLRRKLPVVLEPVEKVGGARSSKTGDVIAAKGKGPWMIGYDLIKSSADNDKISRRVSFSDPVAIVKTMSPSDHKENSNIQQGGDDDDPSVVDWSWP